MQHVTVFFSPDLLIFLEGYQPDHWMTIAGVNRSLLWLGIREYIDINQAPINAMEWDCGRFKPIPPIVDAAVALYSGMDVFEIGHAGAAREDLEKTTNALVQSVLAASYARGPIISMQNNLLHNGRAWSWQDSGWPQYCPPSRN